MRKLAILAATSLVALAMIAPASADGACGADVTAVPVGPETVYLVDTGEGYANGWIYLESNGSEGLQRGGPGALNDTPVFIHYDSDCDNANHDTVIY